jgi:tetratricopeptide (TPR) repeat protein
MERCLARHEADARCHWWLGRAYGRKALEAGMVGGVRYAGRIREHFERAAALEPQAVEIRYDLHQFYILAPSLAGGGKAKARASLAEFARLRPAEASLLQAQLDLAEERTADAESRLLAFAGADDRAVRTVWQDQLAALGFRYFAGKPPRLDDAQRVFDFAARRFPDNELFQRALGRVAQEQARYEAAALHFERALAIKPQPGAHYRLAQVAEKLGDTARAITHYEKTVRFPYGVPPAVLRDASERLRVLNKV